MIITTKKEYVKVIFDHYNGFLKLEIHVKLRE